MGVARAGAACGGGGVFLLFHRLFAASPAGPLAGGRLEAAPRRGEDFLLSGPDGGFGRVYRHRKHCGSGCGHHRRGARRPVLDVGVRPAGNGDGFRGECAGGPPPGSGGHAGRHPPGVPPLGQALGRPVCGRLRAVFPGHGEYGPNPGCGGGPLLPGRACGRDGFGPGAAGVFLWPGAAWPGGSRSQSGWSLV